MHYHVIFTPVALKNLKKLDKHDAAMITSWIEKNLEGCSDPRVHGRGLVANRSGQWRYRVGDYRIITEIHDDKIVIMVMEIGHRRYIYD